MKITKADIQKVVLKEIVANSTKDPENFATTDADWERFKIRLEEGRSESARSGNKHPQGYSFLTLRNLIAAAAALAAVVLLTTLQGTQTTLRFAKADAFRGDNPGANPANTPKWIADQHLDIQWNLAEQTLSLPLLDGTVVPVKLAPAPELNLNDEAGLRFFRLNETSTTLRAGESVQIRGTLQIRATQLAAADTTPKRLSEVESALFKLKLTAKDGRSQDLWYEFKR